MLRRIVVVCSILVLAATAPAETGPVTNTAQNVAIVEIMFKAINGRDFDRLDAVMAKDVVRHSGARGEAQVTSLEQFKAFLKQDLEAVPDAAYEINFIFGGEGKVAVHATYRGTQTGDLGSYKATGKRLELPFMGILRIEGGMIAEIWTEWDNLTALTQLGYYLGE